jgi:GNAT superfamily N-acetyltransferase
MGDMELRTVALEHPDARQLIAAVQLEYVDRYGGEDGSPVDPIEFAPPQGTFLVGYLDGAAVASGGWRRRDGATVEIKRMYVVPAARRRGYACVMLAELERSAAAAGYREVVLESGAAQPEALRLYESCGYLLVEPFGHYRCAPSSRHYGKSLAVRQP